MRGYIFIRISPQERPGPLVKSSKSHQISQLEPAEVTHNHLFSKLTNKWTNSFVQIPTNALCLTFSLAASSGGSCGCSTCCLVESLLGLCFPDNQIEHEMIIHVFKLAVVK